MYIHYFYRPFGANRDYSVSEITVTIKNQGEDAYKPKIYGDSILIRRQFSKTGSSSYKIMSKDGKVISTKREELSNICDHLNIQVDNPMNILTQGELMHWSLHQERLLTIVQIRPGSFLSSRYLLCHSLRFRQFLAASSPADKYKVRLVDTAAWLYLIPM